MSKSKVTTKGISKYNVKRVTTGLVYTRDYKKFKVNSLYPAHTKYNSKLEQDLLIEGTNLVPIQVDKDMNVIDGHGRLQYCKSNNLLLSYIVVHSGTKTFLTLNESSRKLSHTDRIESHGNSDKNYKQLFDLMLKYDLGYATIKWFVGYKPAHLKDGKSIKIDFKVLEEYMIYIRNVQGIANIAAINPIARAIARFDKISGFSRKHLVKKMLSNWNEMNPTKIGGMDYVMQRLSDVYDHKAHAKNRKNLFYKANRTAAKS